VTVAAKREEILRLIGRLSATTEPEDVQPIAEPRRLEAVRGTRQEARDRPAVPHAPVFCWDYLAKGKPLLLECQRCVVHRLGAYRCYEVAKLPRVDGVKVACPTTCDQCDYHDWVQSQPRSLPQPFVAQDGQLGAEMLALYRGLDERLKSVEMLVRATGSAPRVELTTGSPPTLAGQLVQGLLPDVLQLISSNVMSGIFRVTQDGSTIKVHFRDGEIVHAEGEGLQGESAFFAVMAMDGGEFAFLEADSEPPQRTIEGKAQFLILEALRQIDEKNGGEGAQE
jgi:hypothetical protein